MDFPADPLLSALGHSGLGSPETRFFVGLAVGLALDRSRKRKERKRDQRLDRLERSVYGTPMNITQRPADPRNFTPGRRGLPIDFLVIHGMAGTLEGTSAWFANPKARASTHFGVGDEIHQYVKAADTAWGVRQDRCEVPRINERSLQMEIQNRDRQGNVHVTDVFLANAADLGYELCNQIFKKRPDRSFIKAHNELDPQKRECPADIDVDFLVREMQNRWDAVHPSAEGIDQPVSEGPVNAAPASYAVPITFSVKVSVSAARLRTRQDLAAPIKHVLPQGTVLTAHAAVEGSPVNGVPTWYRVSWEGDDYLFVSASITTRL